MKYIFIISFLFFYSSILSAQKVNSTCTAPDSIIKKYSSDAQWLSYLRIIEHQFPEKDSIVFKYHFADTFLNSLVAIYNATSLAARDTVVKLLNIHTAPNYALNCFGFKADTSLQWVKNIINGTVPCGDSLIDSIFSIYKFRKSSYTANVIYLKTDSIYNINLICKLIKNKFSIVASPLNYYYFEGYNIKDSVFADHVLFTFEYGWGDCSSGCLFHRYWDFNVYFDCSVEFIKSFGDILNFMGIKYRTHSPNFNIYPNPTSTVFTIYTEKTNRNENVNIYNMLGEKIHSDIWNKNETQKTIDVAAFPKGIYLIRVGDETSKVIIE